MRIKQCRKLFYFRKSTNKPSLTFVCFLQNYLFSKDGYIDILFGLFLYICDE